MLYTGSEVAFYASLTKACQLMPFCCACSDGNLVATLLSHALNLPQANIAHALEKVGEAGKAQAPMS